jgi:hypothetical protein
MAKYLLTLCMVLAVYAATHAQKLSLASTYTFVASKSIAGSLDSTTSKPLIATNKPAPALRNAPLHTMEGLTKATATVELEAVEEVAKLRIQGRQDAKQYYKPKAIFWGTMGTTLLYPAAGLVTGTVVSVVPPSINDEINPNAYLMKEPAYEEAFKKQAHRKRFGNAAAGFGIGVAVLGVVYKVVAGGL